MRFFFGAFIFALSVFLNSIELSLSSLRIEPFDPQNVADIRYYANPDFYTSKLLIPVIAGGLPQPEYDHIYLFGVNINGQLLPIFDNRRRWIFVDHHIGQTVIVTPHLFHLYGYRFPANIISQLVNHNNVELVMPRRSRNGSPTRNSPVNRRPGHD